jgi:hypothetical protein
MKYSAKKAVDGGDKIVRTRDEVVRGEVEIIHSGGKASDDELIGGKVILASIDIR